MLRIRDIILTPDEDKPNQLRKKAAAALGLKPSELKQLHIVRRSIDARKRDRVHLLYTVDVAVEDEDALARETAAALSAPPERAYSLPQPGREPGLRPLIAGFGPAGMFIALSLLLGRVITRES